MRKLALYTCAVARGGALERAPVKERSLWARPATSSSRPPDFPRLLLWADASREETAEDLGCGCCFETSMPLTTREQEALPESRLGGYRDSLLLLWWFPNPVRCIRRRWRCWRDHAIGSVANSSWARRLRGAGSHESFAGAENWFHPPRAGGVIRLRTDPPPCSEPSSDASYSWPSHDVRRTVHRRPEGQRLPGGVWARHGD